MNRKPSQIQISATPKIVGLLATFLFVTENGREPNRDEIEAMLIERLAGAQGNRSDECRVTESDLLAVVRSSCANAIERIDKLTERES